MGRGSQRVSGLDLVLLMANLLPYVFFSMLWWYWIDVSDPDPQLKAIHHYVQNIFKQSEVDKFDICHYTGNYC